jgi:DNA-directed RNA polymerase subunit RPC12/RpoP
MRVRKIKNPETSRTYQAEARDLMLSFCPIIYPCSKCGHPVIKGYCCTTCNTEFPEHEGGYDD